MLGEVFKFMIDENAKKRAEQKSLIDTGYVEHFKTLSSLTVLQGAEDVRKKMKDWETQPEKLIDKANSIHVMYREVKKEASN